MLLSEAKARVQRLIDDTAANLATVAEIADSLRIAQEEVYQVVVGSGSVLFQQDATVTTNAAGVADLTTIKPLDITNVAFVQGSNVARLNVPPARPDDAFVNYTSSVQLLISYIARPTFPSSDSAAFVWGHANVTMTSIFEQLMCCIAASDIKVKEGEVNPALEKRKVELRAAAESGLDIPGWQAATLMGSYPTGTNSFFRFLMTAPDTLQLVF